MSFEENIPIWIFFYLNMPNLNNRYEYAGKKIQRKTLNIYWTTFHHVAMVQILSQTCERKIPVSPSFLLVPGLSCVFLHSKKRKENNVNIITWCVLLVSAIFQREIYIYVCKKTIISRLSDIHVMVEETLYSYHIKSIKLHKSCSIKHQEFKISNITKTHTVIWFVPCFLW